MTFFARDEGARETSIEVIRAPNSYVCEGAFHGARCDEFSIENRNVRAKLPNSRKIVMNEHNGAPFRAEVGKNIKDCTLASRIDPLKCFVEDEEVGLLYEGAGEKDALALTTRELINVCLLYTSPSPRD